MRSGLDGLNENVHNFFVNIFARGGIIHLSMYLYLIYQISKAGSQKININIVLTLLLPLYLHPHLTLQWKIRTSHYYFIFW